MPKGAVRSQKSEIRNEFHRACSMNPQSPTLQGEGQGAWQMLWAAVPLWTPSHTRPWRENGWGVATRARGSRARALWERIGRLCRLSAVEAVFGLLLDVFEGA